MRLISAASGVRVPAPPSTLYFIIVNFVISFALLSEVQACIDAYAMLPPGARVIAAVSGGPDSMALLTMLNRLRHQYGLTLMVAHVNHQLREREAERDEAFVERQASQLGLPFYCSRVEVKPFQRTTGLSPQHAARQLRYAFFQTLQQTVGATHVALGHTSDDQAETLLMRLLRGGGPGGLAGIPAKRLPFVRPLITSCREDIMAFLEAASVPWLVDRSNMQRTYLRNQLRLGLLPTLKQYNPRIVSRLNELADMMRADNDMLENQLEHFSQHVLQWQSQGRVAVRCTPYQSAPLALQRRLLRRLLNDLHPHPEIIGFRHIEALRQFMMSHGIRKRLTLPGGMMAEHQARVVFLWDTRQALLPSSQYLLSQPGSVCIPMLNLRLHADRAVSRPNVLASEDDCAYLDGERIDGPLVIRFCQPGDRFHPLGAPGHKKLKDFFIDQKIPRAQRPYVPLIVSGEDIVWVVGYRIAEGYKVRTDTRSVLRLRCEAHRKGSE